MQINKKMNECTIEKCIQIVGKQFSFKWNLLGIEKKSFESPEMNTGSEMPLCSSVAATTVRISSFFLRLADVRCVWQRSS